MQGNVMLHTNSAKAEYILQDLEQSLNTNIFIPNKQRKL